MYSNSGEKKLLLFCLSFAEAKIKSLIYRPIAHNKYISYENVNDVVQFCLSLCGKLSKQKSGEIWETVQIGGGLSKNQ